MNQLCIQRLNIYTKLCIPSLTPKPGKAMSLGELVVDLGGDMGTSDHIELVDVEECISSNKAAMVYLQEGGLLPYMEGMVKHNKVI